MTGPGIGKCAAITIAATPGRSSATRTIEFPLRRMTMRAASSPDIWFAAGVRTPFAKVDGPLGKFDAIALSVPVVRHMLGLLDGAKPDFAAWGTVVPNLT